MKKAFTLIEILLSIAVLAIIFTFSASVYQMLQNRNDLDIAVNTVAQSYKRAQLLAQAVDGDSSWGVKVQTGQIVIFQGTDYAGRNQNFDENFEMPTGITAEGRTETVFATFTGFPQTPGELTLTSLNNETKTITLNAKGIADY